MLSRRYFIRAGFAAVAATGLAACGNGNASSAAKSKKLTVAASPSPHAEILDNFAAPRLKKQGITLKTKEYTDYIIPNQVTSSGEVDANYFQHINYLNNYNKENGTDLVGVAAIHYEPFGIYAGKSKDLKSIQDGAQIAVPNDPTNEGRALLLLESLGLIKLNDSSNLEATPKDIAENPKNLEFVEVQAETIPSIVSEVDIAVINSNYAMGAGFNPVEDSLAIESADSPYVNILVVKEGNEGNPAIAALIEALHSDAVRDFINEKYAGAVVPAF